LTVDVFSSKFIVLLHRVAIGSQDDGKDKTNSGDDGNRVESCLIIRKEFSSHSGSWIAGIAMMLEIAIPVNVE